MGDGILFIGSVASLFLLAVIAACVPAFGRARPFVAIVPAAWAVFFLLAPDQTFRLPWVPGLNLELAFRLDPLSRTFAVLVTGIGSLDLLYGYGYLRFGRRKFQALILVFMASMLGLVLADNALLLFVFWELTSVTSYLLIGFDQDSPAARNAARRAFVTTAAGGLALLAGLILLTGGTRLSELGDAAGVAQALPALLLIAIGCFTKSAQVPFHFWLPDAMAAPTPISAYLHSATMVQAGVFLLARLQPNLVNHPVWMPLLVTFGVATIVWSGFLGLFSRDLKRILAMSTIAALGTMTALIGLGAPGALLGFIVAHALYKGGLFMVAGSLDHGTHSRDALALGGLRRLMPWTAAAGFLAALSMAGLPPAVGFATKEALLAGGSVGVMAVLVLYAAVSVMPAYAVGVRPFWGPVASHPDAHECNLAMRIGLTTLGIAGLLAGLFAGSIQSRLSVADPAWTVVPHLGVPLALSALGVGLGGGVAWLWTRLASRERTGITAGEVLDRLLDVLQVASLRLTRRLQGGYLSVYVRNVFLAVLLFAGMGFLRSFALPSDLVLTPMNFLEGILGGAIIVGAIAATRSDSRLGAVACLGIVGTGIALLYVLYGAPDLAMTQVAVEVLTLLLFVFAFSHLPKVKRPPQRKRRAFDGLVALFVGVLMGGLALMASVTPPNPAVSQFFAAKSLPEGYGKNVVNVILVDFRAIDTLGEITVMAVAAVGVVALLRMKRKPEAPR